MIDVFTEFDDQCRKLLERHKLLRHCCHTARSVVAELSHVDWPQGKGCRTL